MKSQLIYALGLALMLPCAGAWAMGAPGAGSNGWTASSVPGQPGVTTTPIYYSPLQRFASLNVDEVGVLSRQLTRFRAANDPNAVMVLYHMIRDHTLLANAAQNVLARHGEVAAPTISAGLIGTTPEAMLRQDIQAHQQAAAHLRAMIDNAASPADRDLYRNALHVTQRHLHWLRQLNRGQRVAMGFFGPTMALAHLAGPAPIATAAAPGYPRPIVSRTAGYRQ